MMEEYAKQIREGDFLHDFEVFLRYVENEKIKLSPKLQFIPLKHVKNINSLFRHPEATEYNSHNLNFKYRVENEFPRFYFIDLLALDSGCLEITSKGYYKKGQNFTDFWESELYQKIGFLFLSWWGHFYWEIHFAHSNDFAECLQDKRAFISPILKKTINMPKVDVEEFTGEVIAATGVKWNCEAGDPANSMAKWAVERIILQAMSYFGAVKIVDKIGISGRKIPGSFSLTEPLGKWLVSLLPPAAVTMYVS